MRIETFPIATERIEKGADLEKLVLAAVRSELRPGDVLAITSKVVSLAENQVVAAESIEKLELIKKEAEHYLGEGAHGTHLTWTRGVLILSAGIDQSNSKNSDYILYPKNPYLSARKIYAALAAELKSKEIGVVITDSRSTPFRRGVSGFALSQWGFRPVWDRVGDRDLYGRELKVTHVNIADALASIAVLAMGEAAESQPMAIVRGYPLEWCDEDCSRDLGVVFEQDIFLSALSATYVKRN